MVLETHKNSIENVAGFVRRDRKRSFLHHAPNGVLRKHGAFIFFKLWRRRKFISAQAMNFVKRRTRLDAADVLFIYLKVNVSVGELAHDAKEFFDGNCRSARLFYFRFHTASDRDIQVGGGKLQAVFFGA